MHPVSGHECSAATHVCLSFVQVAAESDEIQSFYSLLFLIVIATQIISLNPLWLKFGDLWFFISFVMTKYLRSLVMGAVGGWVGGGEGWGIYYINSSTLYHFYGKKERRKHPHMFFFQSSSRTSSLPSSWALHEIFMSFFDFPWEEILLNTFLQAASHCFQIGWKCFCSYGFLDKMDNKL